MFQLQFQMVHDLWNISFAALPFVWKKRHHGATKHNRSLLLARRKLALDKCFDRLIHWDSPGGGPTFFMRPSDSHLVCILTASDPWPSLTRIKKLARASLSLHYATAILRLIKMAVFRHVGLAQDVALYVIRDKLLLVTLAPQTMGIFGHVEQLN